MKGISTEVIVFLVIALVIAGLLILFFTGRFGPGSQQLSYQECVQKLSAACSKYRIDGNNVAFSGLDACAKTVGVWDQFYSCNYQNDPNNCINMCNIIQSK
jgi:hypothetical protein